MWKLKCIKVDMGTYVNGNPPSMAISVFTNKVISRDMDLTIQNFSRKPCLNHDNEIIKLSVFYFNARSLLPKVDEVRALCTKKLGREGASSDGRIRTGKGGSERCVCQVAA